jgi:choline monooxygenase
MSIINSDISKAETLPSRYYTDSETFEKLRTKFTSNWHFAAHISEFEENNVIPLPHLVGLMREPLVLTKDDDIRCLSNVCTHRGMLIANEKCEGSTLRCTYHGRTFGLDGCFRNMPEFEGVENFPSAADNLKEYPFAEWNGLLFSTLDGTDFEELLKPIIERIGWMPISEFKHDSTRHREWEVEANWALYVDNYLEGFHIPYVHEDLHGALDYDNYSTELFDGGVLQVGMARKGEPCFDLPESSPDYGQEIAAYYYWIFPGLMLNFYPWGLSVNIISPISVNRTKIIYHGYVWDENKLGEGAGADLDKVEMEDQFVVEATQQGVSSSAYERGRYSPNRETGVHHFHRILTSQ